MHLTMTWHNSLVELNNHSKHLMSTPAGNAAKCESVSAYRCVYSSIFSVPCYSGVMLESMLTSSMTTSILLAEECMRNNVLEDAIPDSDSTEGRQQVANAIDAGKINAH